LALEKQLVGDPQVLFAKSAYYQQVKVENNALEGGIGLFFRIDIQEYRISTGFYSEGPLSSSVFGFSK
jgi:hypothetical protein